MKFVFRADGNRQIGSGHVMRCLSLAAALAAQGHSCVFWMADARMARFVEQRGFAVKVLGTEWTRMEEELSLLRKWLAEEMPDCFVVDSYYVTNHYFKAVRKQVYCAYLDDFLAEIWAADTVVNYNNYAEALGYKARYTGTGTALLLGTAYAPLRTEYCGLPAHALRAQATDILLSTGGSDPENLAARILRAVAGNAAFAGATFHVVAGALNAHKAELHALAEAQGGIAVHENVQDMAALMRRCDVAIAAAGSTLYELCACGTPTVTYALADNQLLGMQTFAERGLMLSAGDSRTDGEAFCSRVLALAASLCADGAKRGAMSEAMQHTVDGCGAARLAQKLALLAAESRRG